MANSGTYNHTKIHFAEGSAPTTPDTGEWVVYAKTTGLFVKDDAGVEYGPFGDAASAVAHISDASDAHDASAISVLDTAANFTGTDVEAVLAELQDNIDAGVGGGGATVVRKSADESVSNTTLQDDNELLFAIGASEVWVAMFHLFVTNAAGTGDIKMLVTVPASATVRFGIHGTATAATTNEASLRQQSHTSAALASGVVLSGSIDNYITFVASVANSTNAGNVTLQWAQNSSDGSNATVVKAGSFLVAHQVA